MNYDINVIPLSEREEIISERLKNSKKMGEAIHDFRSETITPKVISLPINIPVYRMGNCRTFSAQQGEIASKEFDSDFFEKGQELSDAQQIQHDILFKLSKKGTGSVTPIYNVLKKDKQRSEILITSSGVVVNGNRRLSALRELSWSKDGKENEEFNNVLCAVLDSDVTRDEIDDIEASLQAKPQTKLDYDWIGDAQLLRRQTSKKGRTSKSEADRLQRNKKDVENTLQALDEADLYLKEWIEKPGRYDLVIDDGQQIFGDIPKNILNKNEDLQNASRAIASSLFENRDKVHGRIYNYNSTFGKLAKNVLSQLGEQLASNGILKPDNEEFEDNFAVDIEGDGNNLNYHLIIEALRNEETKEQSFEILIDICESAIESDRGKKSEEAGLRALSAAHAKLVGVDVLKAGKKYLPDMQKQIEFIKPLLSKIENGIKKRQSGK